MIRGLGRLCRFRLALLNGVAALGGYLLYPAPPEWRLLAAACGGVVLLAAAGSAFNQLLERDLDRTMHRTAGRPLPHGDLTPRSAAAFGALCTAAGLLLLGAGGRWLPPLCGGLALAWYLGVYTPLKSRTSLALAAGGLCGAVPPLIGWCSAGGAPGDYRIILFAGLFFLWQIPHFWLFQERHAADYRRAGIPLHAPRAPHAGPADFCRLWLAALAAGVMLLPVFGITGLPPALGIALFLIALLPFARPRHAAALFSGLNLFPLLLTLATALGQ
jgi:protoheme IX farnesyltransferase